MARTAAARKEARNSAKQPEQTGTCTQSDPDPTSVSQSDISRSRPQKLVSLHGWWLARDTDNGLAVAGYTPIGRFGLQKVFLSGRIAKRHDSTTLESVDGVKIILHGTFNSLFSLKHGYSLQVCNHFMLGFPYEWDNYLSIEEATETWKQGSVEDASCSSVPVCFDNIPDSRMRDLLTSPRFADCDKRDVLEDVLRRLRSFANQNSGLENNETPTCHKRAKVNKKSANSGSRSTVGIATRTRSKYNGQTHG